MSAQTPEARRAALLHALESSQGPLSASSLAKRFGVSRQVIVGDVALLRAAQQEICATPRGYLLERPAVQGLHRTVACCHIGPAPLQDELYTVVDCGCALLDVMVEHSVYGELRGQLHIFSRLDADNFLKKLAVSGAAPLSLLTGGVHLHTLSCPSEGAFAETCRRLASKGILYRDS